MERITYGINTPIDLLAKLEFDSEKLDSDIDPYNIFNFFITASVLYEWTKKHYPKSDFVVSLQRALKDKNPDLIPEISRSWITNDQWLPNKKCDSRRHIYNAISICWEAGNASKHYHWNQSSPVTDVGEKPNINNLYQYFFTSTEPGLYVEFSGEYYNLNQIKGILLQFYKGALGYLSE